ncbi:MAG TPA: GNAT family N-acetyltransferase [Lysobacter sp.]
MRATFRTARVEDAQRLSALMRETFIAAYGHCSSPENVAAFLDMVYSTQRQRAEIADGNVVTLIAEIDDVSWAGFAQLRFAVAAPNSVTLACPAELGRIYLSPAYHGQGVAAGLMQRSIGIARARGCDGLWLNVWQEAPQAIRFYGKHGFEVVGRSVFVVGVDPKDDWVMQKAA